MIALVTADLDTGTEAGMQNVNDLYWELINEIRSDQPERACMTVLMLISFATEAVILCARHHNIDPRSYMQTLALVNERTS